jgi:hypothetical protein
MTADARFYDTVNVGREVAASRETRFYDTVNVGLEVAASRETRFSDTVNLGLEIAPITYHDQPQAGWGVALAPAARLGQIAAYSEGRTYDTVDVTA